MLCPRIAILRYAGNRRSNAAYYPLPYVSLSYVRFRHVRFAFLPLGALMSVSVWLSFPAKVRRKTQTPPSTAWCRITLVRSSRVRPSVSTTLPKTSTAQ